MFEGEPEELEDFIKYGYVNLKDGERALLKSRRKVVEFVYFHLLQIPVRYCC